MYWSNMSLESINNQASQPDPRDNPPNESTSVDYHVEMRDMLEMVRI